MGRAEQDRFMQVMEDFLRTENLSVDIRRNEADREIYVARGPEPFDSTKRALLKFFMAFSHYLPNETIGGNAKEREGLDRAMSRATNGGIDFNSANLNLFIKRDGRGVPLPLARQDMAQLGLIQGFVPQIIEIKPAVNVPILSELQQKLQSVTS
jgi:hypothetical protein